MLCGVLLLDKPPGITSSRALQRVRALYRAARAGHTGALDPLATGVLPICLGEATKFSAYFLQGDKTYEACATLGVRTDTLDAEGSVISRQDPGCAHEHLAAVLPRFCGSIMQLPPRYSALKLRGRPLYSYARAGEEVELRARSVTIRALELLGHDRLGFRIRVHCSGGTYIRSLIDDIGQALGCGAHLSSLRRLSVQGLPDAPLHGLQELQELTAASGGQAPAHLLLPLSTALAALPRLQLTCTAARRLHCGQVQELSAALADGAGIPPQSGVLYLACGGDFLGVGRLEDGVIRPLRMMSAPLAEGALLVGGGGADMTAAERT